MAKFEPAIKILLQHEGGYVNHPNDPGGATNWGVSLRFLQDQPLRIGDFDGDGDIDVEDIANMTIEDAKKVYDECWWTKYKYGSIVDQTIATKVFDFSVNMGAPRAHKLLQAAMNKAFSTKLSVDGVLGPASFKLINAIGDGDEEQELLTAYCNEAWDFYQAIARNNPKLKVFLKGWKNRAYSLNKSNSIVG